ncbi:MAG: hypothetical protein ACFCUJ_07400 [Thiotrichales bacterium]
MILETLIVPAAGAAAFAGLKLHKARIYRRLQASHSLIAREYGATLGLPSVLPDVLPDFARHFAAMPDCLPEWSIASLTEAAERFLDTERSYVPGHKQGGTIAYETLHETAPEIVAFFQSDYLRQLCSAVVGRAVVPTPVNDQSSCSLLVYDRPRDHIGWHYDHNFYNGRHFTVLVALINRHRTTGGLSSARLLARLNGQDTEIPTPPNTLVMFEGNRVLHKVTPLEHEELRVMLSMTFCTDPRASAFKGALRRVKDIAFFGPRALWS